MDKSEEKRFELQEIAPRATTLNSLRNGKVRTAPSRRRHIPRATRIMDDKAIAEGLARLKKAEEKKIEKQRLIEERKKNIEDKRNAKRRADQLYRIEMVAYKIDRDAWETNCRKIEEDWQLTRDAARAAKTRVPKKPQLPPKPKRPTKPRLVDRTTTEVNEIELEDVFQLGNTGEMDNSEDEMEEVIEQMRALEIEQFANACRYFYRLPFLNGPA